MGKPLSNPAQRETPAGYLVNASQRLRDDSLWVRLLLLCAALLAGALIPLGPHGEIAEDFFLDAPCVFHLVTGLPCPLCGMTRAFANLSRLQVSQAAAFSPAGSVIFGLLACYVMLTWLHVLTGWRGLLRLIRRDYFGVIVFITIMGWLARLWLQAGVAS